MDEIGAEMREMQNQMQSCIARQTQLEGERLSLDQELHVKEATHRDKEQTIQVLLKDFEYAKERETVLLVDRLV